MRITKQIASDVANQLLAKKVKGNNRNWTELSNEVYESVLKTIPKEITELQEKYPSYVRTSQNVRLFGNGFNHENINTPKSFPCTDYSKTYTPTEKEAAEWIKLLNDYKDGKDNLRKLSSEIESALYNLKTYKAVQENFPEAYELLPEKVSTSLSVNISDIRQKIK
jgi:hypothetical protein